VTVPAHHEIFVDVSARIVTIVRTARPFASADELKAESMRFAEAIRGIDRERFGLVVDARNGPGLHDPRLEEPFAAFRKRVMMGFLSVAVVSASVAGRLHAQRNARADNAVGLEVFDSIEDARAHVSARSERRMLTVSPVHDGVRRLK
jgi:hypothetical protein